MSHGKVIIIQNASQFDNTVSLNPKVAIDFTASWCGPCRMIAPKYEEFSTRFTNVAFLKVDVDEVGEIASRFKVSAMPTFKFLHDGKEVENLEIVGASAQKLEQNLTSLSSL